jgi:hypothetical protein
MPAYPSHDLKQQEQQQLEDGAVQETKGSEGEDGKAAADSTLSAAERKAKAAAADEAARTAQDGKEQAKGMLSGASLFMHIYHYHEIHVPQLSCCAVLLLSTLLSVNILLSLVALFCLYILCMGTVLDSLC